jgi:hypothetical protein
MEAAGLTCDPSQPRHPLATEAEFELGALACYEDGQHILTACPPYPTELKFVRELRERIRGFREWLREFPPETASALCDGGFDGRYTIGLVQAINNDLHVDTSQMPGDLHAKLDFVALDGYLEGLDASARLCEEAFAKRGRPPHRGTEVVEAVAGRLASIFDEHVAKGREGYAEDRQHFVRRVLRLRGLRYGKKWVRRALAAYDRDPTKIEDNAAEAIVRHARQVGLSALFQQSMVDTAEAREAPVNGIIGKGH